MYYDYMLNFPTEAECKAALGTEETFDGQTYFVPKYTAVDLIGTIYEDQVDPDLPPVPYPGYHANVRNTEEAPELDQYRVYPPNPVRVWA